ncbi:hypothetical protein DPEC_G00172970 [Dallia pectoralis]|uniref:Uncharacterized protein n=1 Tax=Dallia pectoralis TaxID=75939 RepID=A0ACC2GDP0_DALPE|nr:hypothetical protein DPEC_G00172970 [Dallia pectoralis]
MGAPLPGTPASCQQVDKPDGHVDQLVKGQQGITAGQLSAEIRLKVATEVVDQGPLVTTPPRSPGAESLAHSPERPGSLASAGLGARVGDQTRPGRGR